MKIKARVERAFFITEYKKKGDINERYFSGRSLRGSDM